MYAIIFGVIIVILLLLWFMARRDSDLQLWLNEMFGHSTSKLRGKIVWITGASSGIGEALAYELAANGVKLAISGTNVSRLEEVKRNCISFNQLKEEDVKILSFNVKDYSQHQKQFNSVITHFKTLDILVSNAGKGQRAEFANIDIDVDKEMFEINVFGLINLSRIALRYFLQNNIKGHLVVTSSIAGKSGAPNSSSYSATKHALHGYFESARIETKSKGISVTMLCPGPVVSRIAENVLTDKKDNKYGSDEGNSAKKMRTNRCAHLMAVAIANHLDESWISPHPVLAFTYFIQYWPTLSRKVFPRIYSPEKWNQMRK